MNVIRSTNLKNFINDYGVHKLIEIWGVSPQAIDKARKSGRDIQIVELDGYVEVRESKLLRRHKVKA